MITERAKQLRRKAEKIVKRKNLAKEASEIKADIIQLLNELEIHKVELEMQAQQQWIAEAWEKSALDKLSYYYDSAPAGYFTISRDGQITELNLTGAKMLGHDKAFVEKKYFWQFVAMENRPGFMDFFYRIFESANKENFQMPIRTVNGHEELYVEVEGLTFGSNQECRLTMINITEQKTLEHKIKISESELQRQKINLAQKDQIINDLQAKISQITEKVQTTKNSKEIFLD